MTTDELDRIGHALSTLVQQRYVWLFMHLSRATFLDRLDSGEPRLPHSYAFSEEDVAAGKPAIPVEYLVVPVLTSTGVFAASPDDSETYDHSYVREMTLTGLRGTFLTAFQSYLEFFQVESIAKRYKLPVTAALLFLRQARNIVCHAQGRMHGSRVQACSWREFKIEKSEAIFKLPDYFLLQLIDDIASELAQLLVANDRAIDFVTLNLGYSVSALRSLADKVSAQADARRTGALSDLA